tara:strand:- start:46 stop:2217 length:2172 start_codon:yes stop_codon:yes gene_type:complete
MAERTLPNPNSSTEQLLGEALNLASEQLVYTKNIDKATVYESKAQQDKVKKNTDVNIEQQKEIKELQDGRSSDGGIKQVNLNLGKEGPISQNLEKSNEVAEEDKTRREKWAENLEKATASFKEAASPQGFANMVAAWSLDKTGKAYTVVAKEFTNDTKTGREQMQKGFDKLTNGLGEFGPIINSLKTAFYNVRAVGDVFIGSIRAIGDGAKKAWGFGKNVAGFLTGKGWGGDKAKDMSEAVGAVLDESADSTEAVQVGLGSSPDKPLWVARSHVQEQEELDYQTKLANMAKEDEEKEKSKRVEDFYKEQEKEKRKEDKPSAKDEVRQRARDKIQKEGEKRAKQEFKNKKKDRATSKKTAAASKKTAAMRFSKYILFFGLILAALAALKWALGNWKSPGVLSGLGRIAGQGLSTVGRVAGRGLDALGRVGERFSNWRSGQGFRTTAQVMDDVAGPVANASQGGWRSTRWGQFATKWGTRLARGAPVIASTAEGVIDWRDAHKKKEKIDYAYKNQIPIAGLDGEGSPPRLMTEEEYNNYQKEITSDKWGAGGRAAGGFAGAWAGFKAGMVGGGALGSVVPGVGTAIGGFVGGILGAIGGGIWGARKGDELATSAADWVQGGVDREKVDKGPWWHFGFSSNEGNRGTAAVVANQIEIPTTGVDLENSEMEIAENRINNQVRGAGNTNITNTSMTTNSGNTESIFTGTVDMNDGMFFRPNYRPLGAQ